MTAAQLTDTEVIKNTRKAFWKMLATTPYLDYEDNPDYVLCYSTIKNALFNTLIDFNNNQVSNPNFIQSIRHVFSQRDVPFCWWISRDDHADFGDKLHKAGFECYGNICGVLANISNLDLHINMSEFSKAYKIKTVATSDDFKDWINPVKQCFHIVDNDANQYKAIFEHHHQQTSSAESFIHLIAYDTQNDPVSACTLLLSPKTNCFGIFNCATLENHRGKGLMMNLCKYGLALAQESNCKCDFVMAEANEASVSMFNTLGLQSLLSYQLYLSPPPK